VARNAKAHAKSPNVPVRGLSPGIKRVKALIVKAKLPGVEEGLSYGMPSFKVAGKFLGRVREPGVLVLMCALEEKEFLMQTNPAVYYETDHYKNWPAVLVRLARIGDEELTHRLLVAWRRQAPKKLLAAFEGVPTPPRVRARATQPRTRPLSGKR
jgi:hypothetical protein